MTERLSNARRGEVTLLVAVGRLTYVSDRTSNASYVYDAKGRPTTVTASNGVKTVYTYDNAGRTLSLTHKKTSDNSVLLSYTPTYDSTSARLSSVAEGPTSATTSYTYDAAGRLLTENRTGANPYASTYTYNSRGLRATAFRSEGGVTSHDGTYAYDNASRLSTVTQPGVATENYTWWADSTLKTLPGQTSSYSRKLDYDEEGRLTLLQKDVSGTVTNLFEYGIGYDGARRSTRDIQNNSWTWLPCGVACCAGELTELSSDLAGATWTTLGVGLRGKGLVRWNSDYSLTDFFGRPTAVGSSSGVTTAVYDAFNVRRGGSATLSRAAIRAILGANDDDSLGSQLSGRLLQLQRKPGKPSGGRGSGGGRNCQQEYLDCRDDVNAGFNGCLAGCGIVAGGATALCAIACAGAPPCVAGCLGWGMIGALGCVLGCLTYRYFEMDRCKRERAGCLELKGII